MVTTILELAHAGSSARLLLAPDPQREQRALVHGAGHALSHAGELDGDLRELVLRVADRFADSASADPITLLRSIVAELAPAARITVSAAAPGQRSLPRWPVALRTGPPTAGLWPFDGELAGLQLGRRELLKRECFTDETEAADRAWLETHHLSVERVGSVAPDGRRILLAARDRARLRSGADAERALVRNDDPAAIRQLGHALGYPSCCVEAFIAVGAWDDLSMLEALLPSAGHPPSPAWTQWLNQPLALVSHVPCGLGCAATIDLARALLEQLEHGRPGFSSRWRELAARVHVIDEHGRGLALKGTGSLKEGLVIEHAVALVLPQDGDLAALARDLPEAVGLTVRVGADIDIGGDVVALFAADHTGLY